MSHLIERPDYIKYSDNFFLRQTYTQEEVDKLEKQPALFQWTLPHVFIYPRSATYVHLITYGILGVPYGLVFLYAIYANIMLGGEWFDQSDQFILLTGGIFTFAYGLMYYLGRSNYYHVVYKITESGVLEDKLKLVPKWLYGKQDPTNFVRKMQYIAIPLIILALLVHPLFLAGAGGMILYGFRPVEVSEGEKAEYNAFLWDCPELSEVEQITKIKTHPKRHIIQLGSVKGGRIFHIYCAPENYEEIQTFLFSRLPNLKYAGEAYTVVVNGKFYRG